MVGRALAVVMGIRSGEKKTLKYFPVLVDETSHTITRTLPLLSNV